MFVWELDVVPGSRIGAIGRAQHPGGEAVSHPCHLTLHAISDRAGLGTIHSREVEILLHITPSWSGW